MRIFPSLFLVFFMSFTGAALAAVPTTINYQGKLSDSGGNPITATPDITFALYTVSSGGAPVWTETQAGVSVSNGIFSVQLGSVTPISSSTLTQADLWLGVNVAGDGEMSPRQKLTAAPFALQSSTADALAANGSNCAAGQYPLGVDASGNAEGCTVAPKGFMVFSGGGADITSNATQYVSPNGNSTRSIYFDARTVVVPVSCTAKNLYVNNFHYNSGSAGQHVVTLAVDSPSSTAQTTPTLSVLSCTVSNIAAVNTSTTCTDTVNTAAISAGDYITLEVATTGMAGGTESGYGTGGESDISWGFVCE